MARISIATTASCHDYKAEPTTPMVANATGSNERSAGGRKRDWVRGEAARAQGGGEGISEFTCGFTVGPKALLPDQLLLAINLI